MSTKTMKLMVAVTLCAGATIAMAQPHGPGYVRPHSEVEANKPTEDMPIMEGAFDSNWSSLSAWQCPDWFRDAKFGIWAHWDPQCEAEDGDWYARSMYGSGGQRNTFYNYFGHWPDHDWGYKDFCRYWTIAAWQPEELIKLYYEAGARYFMAMGQHHDNYDCWDSPYQEWNSMNIGPKRDVVGEWAEACRKYGMRLGVSMHGAHAWTFFEVGRDADTDVTKEEGTGTWWEGYDPQELYAQNHEHSANWSDWGTIHSQWGWGNGVCPPSVPYMQKFLNRIVQCINKYNPDMIYFDDTVLPFYYASSNTNNQYSLNILKHYYNFSAEQHDGTPEVVVTGKILEEPQKQAMLWDVERGIPDRCQDLPWQTCTCIGGWHYSKYEGDNNMYKQADQVIRMLVDIVSKNGNLLLSIPVRGDGSLDNNEYRIIAGITAWMKINSESIYGTRPYKVFGEGPLFESANPLSAQGFNEGINYSAADVRYVQKDDKVYATIMRWPSASDFTFTSFGLTEAGYNGSVKSVKLLGYGNVDFTYTADDGLTVEFPGTKPNDIAPVFEIEFNEANQGIEALNELINLIDGKMNGFVAGASYNTGKYAPYSITRFAEKLEAARLITADDDPAVISKAIEDLRTAYTSFVKEGRNPGGKLATTGTDITTDKLIEASGFSRSDNTGKRFGTPKYWTVENFTINNPNGTKNGIDNYPGFNTLMLGVWNGEDQGSSSDLANARIFRQVHLDAGTYYFSAQFQAAYQLSKQMYIYAATENATTADLPDASIAFENINTFTAGDGNFYGIEFSIDEEQDVILGFQGDLTRGSNQQEIRVQAVKLIRRSDVSKAKLTNLINTVNTALERAAAKVNENTGYYSQEALERLQSIIDQVSTLPDDATAAQITASYNFLNDAYEDFQVNGLNPGGLPDLTTPYVDLTIEKLLEADNFSRTEATDTGTRFGEPLNWTVQNFNIPNGSDGTKHGIDHYSGADALMLGVWNDRGSNTSGQLTNARIYRQIHLDAGRYYFGAAFNTINSLNKAYIFASDRTLSTTTIATRSIAYYDINSCVADGQFYGIYFTLEEEQDVFLGFQADLKNGSATQEFRATAVKLLKYDTPEPDAIEEINVQSSKVNGQWYDLSGRRVTTPTRGFYIINGKKILVK